MVLRTRKESSTAIAPETLQIVTFRVGTEEFGLAIGSIMEVIRPLPTTPLPHMPQFVEGVINLRGMIIPIVDLRRRFGMPPVSGNQSKIRMLITRGAVPGDASIQGMLGLVVDGVREVLHIPAATIGPAPGAAKGSGTEFIAGVVKAVDRLIILIDITKVLNREERAALAEAGDVNA
jgi:purine-binding chemotaxis protein CheW